MKLLAAGLMFVSAGAAFAAGDWVVVGIVSQWQYKDHPERPIRFGDKLHAGDWIARADANAHSGSISIASGASHKTIDCESGCPPFQAGTEASPGKTDGVWPLLAALASNPRHYYSAVSRNYGTIRDGVVPLRGRDADLSPVFADMGKGTYWIKLQKLDSGKPKSDPAVLRDAPLKVPWNPGQGGMLPSLNPGLYRLQLTNEQGEATGGDAWVLVRGSGDYEKARATYEKTRDDLASWREDVPPAGIRAVLRVQLEQLAR